MPRVLCLRFISMNGNLWLLYGLSQAPLEECVVLDVLPSSELQSLQFAATSGVSPNSNGWVEKDARRN